MWQSIHPTKYMDSTLIANGASGPESANFFLADKAKVNDATGLLPFRKEDDSWLTSKDVRYTTNFGYAYPETQRWRYAKGTGGDANMASAATESVDKLYNTVTAKVSSLAVSRRVAAPPAAVPDAVKQQPLTNLAPKSDLPTVKPPVPSEQAPTSMLPDFFQRYLNSVALYIVHLFNINLVPARRDAS